MEHRGPVDDELRQSGQGGLHGDDRGGRDGQGDAPRDGQPGERGPGTQQEHAAQGAGGQDDTQHAGRRGEGAPVDPVGQRAVPVDEVAGHAVRPDLVPVAGVGGPPAHHGTHVAVGDVVVVRLVVHARGQHGTDARREHGEQEQRQHHPVQGRDDAGRRDHPDEGGHEPLGVLHHRPRPGDTDLGGLLPVGEPVLAVRGCLHTAHRGDEREVRLCREQRGDPRIRVRGQGAADAAEAGCGGDHGQRGQRGVQAFGHRPRGEQMCHGPRGESEDEGCRGSREELADQEQHRAGPVDGPGPACGVREDRGQAHAQCPETGLGQGVLAVLALEGDGGRGRRGGVSTPAAEESVTVTCITPGGSCRT